MSIEYEGYNSTSTRHMKILASEHEVAVGVGEGKVGLGIVTSKLSDRW